MKTMNKILQSLIFTTCFFGIPAFIGLLVFDGFLYPIYWLVGFGSLCVLAVILVIVLYALTRIWK